MIYDPNSLPNDLKEIVARLSCSPDLQWVIVGNDKSMQMTIQIVYYDKDLNTAMTPLGTNDLLYHMMSKGVLFYKILSMDQFEKSPLQNPLFVLSLERYEQQPPD